MSTDLPEIVVVTGPTASGNTPVAIDLARRFDGEIVNADSMQIFRFMDSGTAKPSLEQRAAVPHHMIDVVAPNVPYSAGRYADESRAVVADPDLEARAFAAGLDADPARATRERLPGVVCDAVLSGRANAAVLSHLAHAKEQAGARFWIACSLAKLGRSDEAIVAYEDVMLSPLDTEYAEHAERNRDFLVWKRDFNARITTATAVIKPGVNE